MKLQPSRRPHFPSRRSAGFTLIELLVVVGIVSLLITLLLPGLNQARETANRTKCANNLRQIAQAAIAYAQRDPTGAFPRTRYNSGFGLTATTYGYGQANPFHTGWDDRVRDNNVTASFFLLLRTQELLPETFICPSSDGEPGFRRGRGVGVQESSNWESIPGNLSYSYNCPFATPDTVKSGWRFGSGLGAQFVLAADINPGIRGGPPGPASNEVRHPKHDSGRRDQQRANSNNHQNKGQNVAYCDGHVEFQDTAYCGVARVGAGEPNYREHTYCPGKSTLGFSASNLPVDGADAFLLPTDDSHGV